MTAPTFEWKPGAGDRTVTADVVDEDGLLPAEAVYYQALNKLEVVALGATVDLFDLFALDLDPDACLVRAGYRPPGAPDVDDGPFGTGPVVHRDRGDTTPPLPVVEDLRERLEAAASAPTPRVSYDAEALPRIVDGLIVPALSVLESAKAPGYGSSWVLIPVGQVASIGQTARAVGVMPRTGRWQPVWIGDEGLDAVFAQFAADFSAATARRR